MLSGDNIIKLKNEISTDPLGLGYKNADGTWRSDQTIADLLNSMTTGRKAKKPIPIVSLLKWAAKSGVIHELYTAFAPGSAQPTTVQAIARAAVQMIGSSYVGSLDTTDPDIAAMINTLELAGILTAVQKAEVLALTDKTVSRAEELELGFIEPGYVESARRL